MKKNKPDTRATEEEGVEKVEQNIMLDQDPKGERERAKRHSRIRPVSWEKSRKQKEMGKQRKQRKQEKGSKNQREEEGKFTLLAEKIQTYARWAPQSHRLRHNQPPIWAEMILRLAVLDVAASRL